MTTAVTLRPYQVAALDRVRAEFARGARRVLLVMPTGAGKTATAAPIVSTEEILRNDRCANDALSEARS